MRKENNMADYIVRATAAEGQIRAFAATTKEMAETARKAHNCQPGGHSGPGTAADGRRHDGRDA